MTKKFVYKIAAQAEYRGEKELADLQSDLKKIGDIKSFEKIRAGWKKTRAELATAKEKAKELRVELKRGGGKDIEKQYKAANQTVARLTASMGKQTAALKTSSAALGQNGTAVAGVSAEYKKLEASATAQAKKIAAVNKLGVRTSADILADIKAREKAYDDLKTGGVSDLQTLARAEKALKKQTSALKQELNGVKESGIGGKEAAVGIAGGVASIGIAAKGIEAGKFFAGFEDDLLATEAFANATQDQFVQLKEAAYQMADGSAGPEQLTAGFAVLANAGMDVSQILGSAGIVKDMTVASQKTLDFAAAGDVLTDVINLYGMKISQAGTVGDILVKGWTSAAQVAPQLADGITEAGSIVAKVYENLSQTDQLKKTVSILSALADAGFKGGKGGTALKNGLRQLIKPGNEAREVLAKYKDVIKVFDDTGNVRDFKDIIKDIGDAGLDAKETMALFGSEAGPAMAALVKRGSGAIETLEQKIAQADGTAARVAYTLSKGLGGATRNASSQFKVFALKLVSSVEPALMIAANSAAQLGKYLAGLPTPVLATGVAVAGLAAASVAVVSAFTAWAVVGPSVVVALTTIKGAVLSLSATFVGLRAAIATTIASMGVLGTASAALAGAWGAVKIYEAVGAYRDMRKAQGMAAESAERAQKQQEKYKDRLARVSEALGRQVDSYKDVQEAYQSGELAYNAETDTYSKGAGIKIAAIESVSSAKKKAVELEEGELDKIIELYDKYIEKIKEVEKTIAEVSASGQADLFELGLIGKTEQETWNAWRDSAKGLGEQIRQTVTEAKGLAAKGDIDAANLKFAEAVELGKAMQSQYKGLAKTIKNEFSKEAQAALEKAKDNVKTLSKEGTEAIQKYKKALSDLKGTSDTLADAQKLLAAAQRENAQAGMAAAQVYQDQAKYADSLAEASRKAAAGGDWDTAVEKARLARDAYKELASAGSDVERERREQIEKTTQKELAELEKRGLSEQAAADKRAEIERRAAEQIAALKSGDQGEAAAGAGVEKALQLEIEALKKKEAEEKRAVVAAKQRSDEIAAAKAKEVEKISVLEEQKAGIAQTAEESAKVAQAGVQEAVELVNGALESQKTILEDITKTLDENTGGAITRLKDQSKEFSDKWTSAAQEFGDETVRQANRASDALDDAARARTAVITTQTVAAKKFGGIIGTVTAMSTGGPYRAPLDARAGRYFAGYGGGDTWANHVIAENGEYMLRKEPVRAAGIPAAAAFNRGDFVGVVRNLAARLPHVRDSLVDSFSLPALPRLDSAAATPAAAVPENLPGIELHNIETGQRESIFSTPSGLDMLTRGLARSFRLKSSGV